MLAFWPVIFSKLSQDGAPSDSRHSNSCCKVRDDDIVVVSRLTIASREAKKKRSNATTVGSYLHVAPPSNSQTL